MNSETAALRDQIAAGAGAGVPNTDAPEYVGARTIDFSEGAIRVSGPEECWLHEWIVSTSGLSSSLRCELIAQLAGDGVYRVRLGGTRRTADGPIIAELNTDGLNISSVIGPAFDNPGGRVRVKLCGYAVGPSNQTRIYSPTITLK